MKRLYDDIEKLVAGIDFEKLDKDLQILIPINEKLREIERSLEADNLEVTSDQLLKG